MLWLSGPAADKPGVVKTWYFASKSPAHATVNAENSAFLAHLEPEIHIVSWSCLIFSSDWICIPFCILYTVSCKSSVLYMFLLYSGRNKISVRIGISMATLECYFEGLKINFFIYKLPILRMLQNKYFENCY